MQFQGVQVLNARFGVPIAAFGLQTEIGIAIGIGFETGSGKTKRQLLSIAISIPRVSLYLHAIRKLSCSFKPLNLER